MTSKAGRMRWWWRRRGVMRSRPLRCEEMVELVTAYLEDALDADDRARFETHLQM